MKSAEFAYHRPVHLEAALKLLNEFGDECKVLAGGQSLMPLMNFRLAQPAHLIDINFIDGLDYVRRENGAIQIGCLARQADVLKHRLVKQYCPLLAAALVHVGYEQTRQRGTVCGSLAHADPAAELPAALLALDGWVTVGNARGIRQVAARDLFKSYLTTTLGSDEIVLETSFPEQPANSGSAFVEFARRFGDFAIVGVSVFLTVEGEGITEARIALTGVGDRPWRERGVEQELLGQRMSSGLFDRVAGQIAAGIDPPTDIHASAVYRRSLAQVLTRRALSEASNQARNGN